MLSWRYIGIFFIVLGLDHTFYGIRLGLPIWQEIAQDGFINVFMTDMNRMANFWIMYFGLILALLGYLCFWIQRTYQRLLPTSFAFGLMILGVVGVLAFVPAINFQILSNISQSGFLTAIGEHFSTKGSYDFFGGIAYFSFILIDMCYWVNKTSNGVLPKIIAWMFMLFGITSIVFFVDFSGFLVIFLLGFFGVLNNCQRA